MRQYPKTIPKCVQEAISLIYFMPVPAIKAIPCYRWIPLTKTTISTYRANIIGDSRLSLNKSHQ